MILFTVQYIYIQKILTRVTISLLLKQLIYFLPGIEEIYQLSSNQQNNYYLLQYLEINTMWKCTNITVKQGS